MVGLITPTRDKNVRRTNKDLAKNSDWVRQRIDEDELKNSQFERVIRGKRKPTVKPISWYPNPDIFISIFKCLKEINSGNSSKAFQWLNSEEVDLGLGRKTQEKPIDMLGDRVIAERILKIVESERDKRRSS